MHTDPNPSLPDEILDHLDFSEIPDTQRIWELSAGYYSAEPPTEEFEYAGRNMWPLIDKATRPRQLNLVFTWKRSMALAACIAVFLSVGIWLMQQPTSVFAPHGEQVTHELPDGSTVMLNSGTRIKYSKNFGNSSRQLELRAGEIYLNVQRSSIPFVVKSFDAETEVLGTSFNVRSWPGEINAATGVAVESGKVRVTPRSASNLSVTLIAGQSAKIQPNGQKPLVVEDSQDSSESYAWVNGDFKFSEQSLGNVTKEIERRYDVKIEIQPPSLESRSIGILKESPESVEEIISDICTLNCTYRATPDGFLLTPR